MTSASPRKWSIASIPFIKIGIISLGAFYLYVAAATISGVQGDLGAIGWPKVIGFALAPICIFASVRYPVVFPFGLYIALAPFDSLFSVSGAASLVKFIGFAVLAALGLRTLRLRKIYVPQSSWYWWLAFVVFASLSIFWDADFDNGWKTLGSFLSLFVLMTVLATYPITKREFNIILGLVVVSGLGAALFCVKEYYSGVLGGQAGRLDLSQDGFAIDVNYLAGSFIAPTAIAMAGIFYVKNLAAKAICAATVFLSLAAIAVNGSRDAFVAVGVIFVFFVIRSGQRAIASIVGGLGLGSIFLFPSLLNRMFEANMADGSGRTEIWTAGMHNFWDHWMVGAGVGSYMEEYDKNILQVVMQHFTGWHRPGHSIVFVSLNDYGILGSLLVVACWYFSFKQLSAIKTTSNLYPYRLACQAAIIGLSIQALFMDPFYIKYVWFAHSLSLMVLNLDKPRAIGFRARRMVPIPKFRGAQAFRGS